jgi:hypothetical protein
MADKVIKELWEIKDCIAQEYDYDVDALVAHLRTRKREGDHQVVDLRSMKKISEQSTEADQQRGALSMPAP